MHVTKLAAVALIKDYDHMLLINFMVWILLDEGGELLNGCNYDMGVRVLQLALQNHGAGVAIGCAFLETVVFLHGLVVQILTIYHEEDLIDIRKL